MAVASSTVQIQYRILPLTIHEDDSATVVYRRGFVLDGVWNQIDGGSHTFSPVESASILDATPTPGLTRRQDLGLATYQALIAAGVIPPGDMV